MAPPRPHASLWHEIENCIRAESRFARRDAGMLKKRIKNDFAKAVSPTVAVRGPKKKKKKKKLKDLYLNFRS